MDSYFKSKPNTAQKSTVKGKLSTNKVEETKTAPKEECDSSLQLKLLSKVHKMEGVEDFTWKFRPSILKDGKVVQGSDNLLKDLQCILISVGWGNHEYILDEQSDSQLLEQQPVKKKLTQMKLTDKNEKKSEAFKGVDVKTLMKLQIPDAVMREGILFIWVEKELISILLDHFETQGFVYVENVAYVMLDESKRKGK